MARALCITPLFFALALGCGTEKDEGGPCKISPGYMGDLHSCVQAESGPQTGGGPAYEHTFDGTIEEVITTSLPECFYSTGPGFSLKLETSSAERWIVGISEIGLQSLFHAGDVLSVDAVHQGGSFSRPDGLTRLTLRRDGELVVYIDEGLSESLKPPPEVTAVSIGEGCLVEDSCGDWAARPISLEMNGEKGSIQYGAQLALGKYTARGGFSDQLTSAGCADYSVEYLALSVSLTAASAP